MRIILAETGTEFQLDNSSLTKPNELYSIKKKVEGKVNIKHSEQILVSATGIQLKESDTKISDTYDTIVVFNRRLLQDPACVQQLVGSIKLTSNVDLPSLKQVESMSVYEDQVFIDTIHRIEQESIIFLRVCISRYSTIDQLTSEINAQTIALNAAFNNLESHIRAAHQNISKFDRIAQREFAKHAISIGSIDLDIELLQRIQLHPRACDISNSTQLDPNTTLGKLVPIKELEKCKHLILTKYDQLVSGTLEQKNKVSYLYQQTTHLSAQLASLQLSIQGATKIKNEVSRGTEAVSEIEKKILHQIKRVKKKDSLYLELNGPPSPPRSMDAVRYSTRTKSNNKLMDLVKTLYFHLSFIEQAEISVRQEKKDSVTTFVHCMQSISQVEESVTKIYPKLADLEKEIKFLRRDIEKGNGTTARRVIAGYGILLIELWRRDKYTEIVKGNANLLQTLFSEFGQLEQSYRKGFEQEIVCVDKQHMLSTESLVILPFQMQNMDEPPIICTTGTVNESEENIVIVTRANVQEYIQMVHSFYAGSLSNTSKRSRSTEQTTRDVSSMLTQRLEREAKRIRIGLSKLGLPNSSVNETNQNESAKGFSPSFPSSATSSHYFTPDMKLASPASHMNTNPFYQQQKDWELEKTSILRQSQDYRKYIDDLNIKHEKDKQSLLRKLQLQEQRIEEIEGNYANQTQEFQSKIQNAEKYHKIKEQEWKQQYEATLQTEQEKYDRRVNGFHQRMHAKDQEFAKLEESMLRETKSAPSSPISSTFPQSFPQHNRRRFRNQPSPPVVSKEQYDHDISLLQQEINQLRTDHQQQLTNIESQKSTEINQITSSLQNQHTAQLKQVADALQSEHTCKNQELLLLILALESEKKSYVEKLSHFDALKNQMDLDRTKEFELHESMLRDLKQEVESLKKTNQKKLLQVTEKFQKSESRMKSLFMNENQQLTMQCQAKVENLIAEHRNNLQELSDTLENDNQVVRIKHQTAFEELDRVFTNQKLEWDQKWSLLNKQNQKITLDYTNFKKETRLKTKELTNLQQELKTAKRIANDVLSVSVDSNHQKFDPNTPLLDLLRRALSNVSSLKTRTSIMESMESPYMMSSYGY